MAFSLSVIISAIDRLTGPTSAMGRSIAGLEKDMRAASVQSAAFSAKWSETISAVNATGMAMTAAGAAVTAMAGKAVAEAMKAEDAETHLTIILGEQAKALIANAAAIQQRTRFEDDMITQATAVGATFVKLRPTLAQAQEAAANIAEVYGTDLSSAMMMLGKASEGMVMGLRRMGIMVDAADFKARGMAAVYDEVNREFNGAAFSSQSASKGFEQVKNQIGDMAEAAGRALLPALRSAEGVLSTLVLGAKDFLSTGLGQAFAIAGAAAGAAALALGPLLMGLGQVIAKWAEIKVVAKLGWAAMTGPVAVVVASIALIGLALLKLKKDFKDSEDAYKKWRTGMEKGVEGAGKVGVKTLDPDYAAGVKRIAQIKEELDERKKAAAFLKWLYAHPERPEAQAAGGMVGVAAQEKAVRAEIAALQKEQLAVQGDLNTAIATGKQFAVEHKEAVEETGAATEELTKEQKSAIDSQESFNEAYRATEQTVTDAATAVTDANTAITEAEDAKTKVVLDNADKIMAAQDRLRDSQEKYTLAVEDAADREQAALDRVADARARADEAMLSGKERAQALVDRLMEKEWEKTASPEEKKARDDAKDAADLEEAKKQLAGFDKFALVPRVPELEADKIAREGAKSVQEAEDAADKVRVENKKSIASALNAVADAEKAVTKAQTDAAEALAAADKKVLDSYTKRTEAIQKHADAVDEANRKMAKSYKDLADAQTKAGMPVSTTGAAEAAGRVGQQPVPDWRGGMGQVGAGSAVPAQAAATGSQWAGDQSAMQNKGLGANQYIPGGQVVVALAPGLRGRVENEAAGRAVRVVNTQSAQQVSAAY